jgi:polycomb group RING finger protein 4
MNEYESSSHLEDLGFVADRVKMFIDQYESKAQLIRLFLSSATHSFPHIVDLNWRLDYKLKVFAFF